MTTVKLNTYQPGDFSRQQKHPAAPWKAQHGQTALHTSVSTYVKPQTHDWRLPLQEYADDRKLLWGITITRHGEEKEVGGGMFFMWPPAMGKVPICQETVYFVTCPAISLLLEVHALWKQLRMKDLCVWWNRLTVQSKTSTKMSHSISNNFLWLVVLHPCSGKI